MSFDRDGQSDAEFERSLLESAGADAPPHDVRDAWERFAGALSLAAGQRPDDPSSFRTDASATPGRAAAPRVTLEATRATAMRWLLVGLVGGSAVTATIMSRQRRGQPVFTLPVVAAPSASSHEGMASRPESAAAYPGPPVPAAPTLDRPGSPSRVRRSSARRSVREAGGDGQPGDRRESNSSTLAAEVSRMDAARAANAAGEYDEAVRLVERYHQDFPRGALAPDADVVALEAVAAKRDHAEVARLAALFLARYPTDPHAARVKSLAAR